MDFKRFYPCLVLLSLMVVALSSLVGGCAGTVHIAEESAAVSLPLAWTQPGHGEKEVSNQWWREFADERLNNLMERVLTNNADLAKADQLARRALLQAEQAASDRLPELAMETAASGSTPLAGGSREERYSFSASIRHTLDYTGKQGNIAAASRWQARAAGEDRTDTAAELAATTVKLYWRLVYLKTRLGLAEESLVSAQRLVELAVVRHQAGSSTALDILEARSSLAEKEAERRSLEQQLTEAGYTLAILGDELPEQGGVLEVADLRAIRAPEVEAGLPAGLLARRADLRSAEARLRGASASLAAAQAGFYPEITLTGSLGGSSEELLKVVRDPLASIVAGLILPMVEWRKIEREVKISESEFREAEIDFRQKILNALAEVENCLSARQRYRQQGQSLAEALADESRAVEIVRCRYHAGGATLSEWLVAEEKMRQAQVAVADNVLLQLEQYVALCTALGGGMQYQE